MNKKILSCFRNTKRLWNIKRPFSTEQNPTRSKYALHYEVNGPEDVNPLNYSHLLDCSFQIQQ